MKQNPVKIELPKTRKQKVQIINCKECPNWVKNKSQINKECTNL